MRIHVIGTSSQGNCIALDAGSSMLLLDAGIPIGRVKESLDHRLCSTVDAAVITHSHKDHAGHVGALLRMGVDCWMLPETAESIGAKGHRARTIKRSATNQVESYEFDIVNPFDRGEIIGGFGYLVYEDERKNRLIIVTEKDFQKSMSHAQSKDFWTKNPVEMRYKTIVNRVTDKLTIDPEKVGRAYAEVEAGEVGDNIRQEIDENANRGEVIDIQAEYAAPQVEAEAVKDVQMAKVGPDF